ncbi:MAG: secretin N-terminal domain-containing protein [Spirochaetota bacterium]|nr:secretin N-terminal domain-containing protein [Spirochaetota bacterium]
MKDKTTFIKNTIVILSSLIMFIFYIPKFSIAERPTDTTTVQKSSNKKQLKTNTVKSKIKKNKKKSTTSKKKRRSSKMFTLNFKDVEISEFLNVMSQLIKKNIIIDDKVRGKITISSAKKIPIDQAFNIMKSILEIKGLAVVESEHLIKIINIKDAIKKNVEVILDGKKINLSPEEEKTITYLLEIEEADANEIASTLRSLKSKSTDVVVYSTLNMLIFSGTTSEIKGLISIAKALDKKLDLIDEEKIVKGNIHVVHLENADAENLAAVLSRIPFSENAKISKQRPAPKVRKSKKATRTTRTQRTSSVKKPTTKLSIISSKETNSLIITATPEEFRAIRRIIKELDIVREQVLIEALIVEVSADSSWGLGIDWMLGNESGNHLYGGSSIMGTPPNYMQPEGSISDKTVALPLSTGFQIGYLSGKEMLGFLLLNAKATDKNFNILSTPQILTIDNQEAELNVGEEIPIPTTNRITDTGTQFYTFDYKSVGVKLKLTPHITKHSRITLDFYQEVNSVLGQTTLEEGGSIIPPKLGKRDILTKITVDDGKTIVVGGLISNTRVMEETKVPILGDIPLLGWFFKRKSIEYRKTNLLVFITPYIVTKQEKMEAITKRKKEEQRQLRFR